MELRLRTLVWAETSDGPAPGVVVAIGEWVTVAVLWAGPPTLEEFAPEDVREAPAGERERIAAQMPDLYAEMLAIAEDAIGYGDGL